MLTPLATCSPESPIRTDWLSGVAEAAYLLCRFHGSLTSDLSGRQWERMVNTLVPRNGVNVSQGPGQCHLFGMRSASGVRHELDTAAVLGFGTLILESKAKRKSGVSKIDLVAFDRKTFDFYVGLKRRGISGPHYRAIVSAYPISEELLLFSYLYGIVAVTPDLLPLPLLVKICRRTSSRQFFQAALLTDLVRLAEKACWPLEKIFVHENRDLRFDMHRFSQAEIEDLSWLHRSISADILDLVDAQKPLYFEEKAEELLERVAGRTWAARDVI